MNSDRINPMVIKELRQGLKSKSFLATFLGLQGLMVVSMFIFLAAVTANSSDLQFADGFFWFMLGLMLLVFMPLRAFQALYDETKNDTLELLFLTRMDAWQIAFGKWCALVVQIMLLVSAVLPYLVLRYFLGAIDVAGNLSQLALQIIFSMLFTAVGVGLSAWTSRLMRSLIVVGALLSLYTVPLMLYGMTSTGVSGPFSSFGWRDLLPAVTASGIVMMFFVEYGASQIAPPAENHAVRKRGLALLLTAVMILYAFLSHWSPGLMVFSLVLFIPVAVDALCEDLVGIASLYIRLKKYRGLRWFLYPGWVSGFLFVSVVFWLHIFLIFHFEPEMEVLLVGVLTYNTLLLPVVVMRLIPPFGRRPLACYLSVQAVSLALCLLCFFLEEINFLSDLDNLAYLLPMLGLLVAIDSWIDLEILPLLIPTVLMMAVIVGKSIRPLRQMEYLSHGGRY